MCILLFSELSWFLTTETSTHLRVDSSRGEKMRINFDITFPSISCSLLTIDVMDVSGSHQEDVEHTVLKKRLDSKGNLIGIPMKDSIGGRSAQSNSTLPSNGGVKKSELPGYCGSCYGAGNQCLALLWCFFFFLSDSFYLLIYQKTKKPSVAKHALK
jgi:hypothetical protein